MLKGITYIQFLIIFIIILVLSVSYLIYREIALHNYESFTNKINLSQEKYIDLGSKIDYNTLLSEKGELISVSLTDQKIFFTDLNESKMIRNINIDKKFDKAFILRKDKMVYIIFDNDYIYVIDSETLELKNIFHDKEDRYFSNEAFFYQNNLITSNGDSKISVVSLSNGEIITYKYGLVLRGIQLYDNTLFYWETGYNIYAVDPSSLQPIWKYVENRASHLSPVISFGDNKLYFDNVKVTKVFNAKTGKLIIEYPLGGGMSWVYNNYLYLYKNANTLLTSNAKNGQLFWEKQVKVNSIHFIGDYIYLTNINNKTLEKIDRFNGRLLWKTKWSDYIDKVIETSKYAIIQDGYGLIYLIKKDTGEKLWRFTYQLNTANWNVYSHYLVITGGSKIISYDLNREAH